MEKQNMVVTTPISILLVEDDEDDYILTQSFLSESRSNVYKLAWAQSYDDAIRLSEEEIADVILLDYRLGAENGLTFAQEMKARHYPAPIIMLTGQANLDVDLEAMRSGVVDYLNKEELTPDKLERSVRYALQQAQELGAEQAARRFLLDVLDALPQSVAILDGTGSIVAVNGPWRSFAHENNLADPSFGIGVNYIEVCEQADGPDAADAKRVAEAIRRAIAGAKTDFMLEYPCHSDSVERWFSVRVSRFQAPDAGHVIVSHQDITRRNVAERELLSAARMMEALLESSPAAIVGVDLDACITQWNPAAEELFGWTREEIVGEFLPFFPENERAETRAYHQRVMNGEIVGGRDANRLTKDGASIPVHVSAAPVRSADGTVQGTIGIFLDLRARLQAEDDIRRREHQYRVLVENLPDTIARYDRNLRRVYGNQAAAASVRASGGDPVGENLSEIGLPPSMAEEWDARLREVLRTAKRMDVEWVSPVGNGTVFETRLVPELAPDGTPESVLAVSQDITERKRRETEHRILEETSSRLAATLDLGETLSGLLEILVPNLADMCTVSLFDEGGMPIRRVAVAQAGADGSINFDARPIWQTHPLDPSGAFGISRVYNSGEAALHEDLDLDDVRLKLLLSPIQDAVPDFQPRSAMFVPMKVRGNVIGGLSFFFGESSRRYSEDTLKFAQEVANRAATAIDNTRLHRELLGSEERHRTLVEQIPAVVFTTDAIDMVNLTYMSPQIKALTGYSPDDFISGALDWFEIVHPEDQMQLVAAAGATLVSGDERSIEYRLITRDGRTIWVREEARLIRQEAGDRQFWQGILSDVTIQKEMESQLIHQAFHDTLTGLPNRALFNDRVQHAQARRWNPGSGIAVCFMDLDNFKMVNDSLGHSFGDALLQAVADRLRRSLRQNDTAARLGGDEFALLIEDVGSVAGASRLISRLLKTFDQPFSIGKHELYVTPSIGVTIANSKDIKDRDLLREADFAMYEAKRGGGSARFEIFNPTLMAEAVRRLELENDLRKTLQGEQMEVYYQPIINMDENTIVGVEALVRWNHPKHGLIMPDRFIPVTEETGMIVELGRWILEEACGQLQEWNTRRDSDSPLTLAVNLSARQFSHASLVDDVRLVLTRTGLEPERLCLEITETVMTNDEDATSAMLGRLKDLGIQLAIDDFGVGYSSLTSLRRFPVNILKIDRSFVNGLMDDPNDAIIVSGVIDLAHALGLEVIAEGVETDAQVAQLAGLNCDLVQGYYFARPMDASTFERDYLPPYPLADIVLDTVQFSAEGKPIDLESPSDVISPGTVPNGHVEPS
jgi:diguanylate cyclase (GGDEF)-like protein/PAS domain S-box-containing protein